MRALGRGEVSGEKLGGFGRGLRVMNQVAVLFAPFGGVAALDFADALDDGLPKVAEDGEGLWRHRALIEHFPHNGELDESARATGADDEAIGAVDEGEEATLPGGNAGFFVDPLVGMHAEKVEVMPSVRPPDSFA